MAFAQVSASVGVQARHGGELRQTSSQLMSAPALPHRRYTIAEYVQLEAYSNVRHEYLDGQIYAMAGGSPEHGSRAANVIALLAERLRGRPCRVQTSDVRVRVTRTGLDTYPDVSVVCGRAEVDPEDALAIINPTLLVEVLSPSTEEYDRGEKLAHYQKIASLREVVFVAHAEKRLQVIRRQHDGTWASLAAVAGERLLLESLDCELSVDDVYFDPLATA
jgi:Uma2 family endonuclease